MRRGMTGVLALVVLAIAPAAEAAKPAQIKVLSNRADIVSGGDALVQVKPRGAKVFLGKRNVTKRFAVRPDGRYLALLTGLRNGKNVVTARKGRRGARLVIRNHPIGGPVTAGPQIQPWTCFEDALDKQCNRKPEYTYYYKSSDGGSLQEYDPESPPEDVATTETDSGDEVPFIVREEIGALDRDEYRIAALYDPSKPAAPWMPPKGLNGRLVVFHGASCDTAYEQADAPDVMNEEVLGHGFVTMSHALNNAGHNCNIATQAESMIMTKERVVEQFGQIRWTIGSGCSGGALVQQQVANAYPGFYQGITPACSFTDAWSSAMQYVNYQLLRRYYENPTEWGTPWTPTQMAAVEGHVAPANAITFTSVIPSSGEPSRSCPGVPPEQVYDEETNPKGVRCTLHDYTRNVFGLRKEDGFAGRPLGNIGLQYGLKPLLAGDISADQFVDLNEKIGSFGIDYDHVAERTEADRPALENGYRSGAVNQATHMNKVAIIDMRGPDPGAFHDVYRTYTMRARLDRNFGTHANQILWRGQVAILGDPNFENEGILAMDKWLEAVDKDRRRIPLAKKIIEDKPESVADRCTDGNGNDIEASACDATVVAYSDPQLQAGMPETNDTTRCELKPMDRSGYEGITFTDEQWERLQKVFPGGVCDFSKPGLGRTPTIPWLTYQDARGRVIYGGKPLGKAPRSRPLKRRR